MEVVEYEHLSERGKTVIRTNMDDETIGEFIQQWTRLQYLWKKTIDAIDFMKPVNENYKEQKALVVYLEYAIKGKLPEMIKLHRKIMEKDSLELDYVIENEKSYSIDDKETKHEEAVRKIGIGQKKGYEFRKAVLEDTIHHLQLPNYQEALEVFCEVNKDKLEIMEPMLDEFYETYTKE